MNTPPTVATSSVLHRLNSQTTYSSVSKSTIESFSGLTLQEAQTRLEIENRLKAGAENLLQVLDTRTRELPKEAREVRRQQVMEELNQTNAHIIALRNRIDHCSAQQPVKLSRRRYSEDISNEGTSIVNNSFQNADAKSTTPAQSGNSCVTVAEHFHRLAKEGQAIPYYIALSNDLVSLLKRSSPSEEELVKSAALNTLITLCSSSATNLVASGYRIARHIIHDTGHHDRLLSLGLEKCLITSLAKDQKSHLEREQALKLIRAFYSQANVKNVPIPLLRALVSLAEGEERTASIALETLTEFAVLYPEQALHTGSLRTLLNSLIEGSSVFSDECVMVINYALESPKSRQNLQPGKDLDLIFAPFTEYVEGKWVPGLEERLLAATTVIHRLLNTWPGLLGISMYDYQGVKSIIDALRVPKSAVRGTILDFLFTALSIPVSNMTSTFLAGRRLTTMGRIPISAEHPNNLPYKESSTHRKRYNLMNQFSALKLLLFVEVGILDALMILVEDGTDLIVARKATLLVGEVLQLSHALLPLCRCRSLQSLPRLFTSAANLRNNSRVAATAALYQIESLNRTRNRTNTSRIVHTSELNSKRGQRQVEQVKIKMGLQIDDAHFRNLLLDSQVLSTKNYTKWHWDTLIELVQGPLLNPKRLEESIRATKFMKRLLAFYRPFTHRFSAIKNTKPNQKYVRFGSMLLETLLANADGAKYLTESKLLRQLSECLAQMDPMNHVTASDALFSRARVEETLCHGYFELLGTLSAHSLGVSMMERWRMFSSLYHLTELKTRADLVTLFLQHLDYSYEGHSRIILGKALTTGLLEVRMFATKHLGTLIRDSTEDRTKIADWAVRLLVTQLYDPSTAVCEVAISVLEVACDAPALLEYIVELRPALDHLGDIGGPLMLRFLATSVGFHYLRELRYIDREMDDWFHGRNDEYVTLIEATLLHEYAPRSTQSAKSDFAGYIPHFYGELAKTAEGVEMLLVKGHFNRYVELLQSSWKEEEHPTVVHKIKAALWAIGSIGATERGAPFLKNCNVVRSMINIAEKSTIASLKGTAYYVLGMVSSTKVGIRLLEDYGWQGVVTNMETPIGICVPRDIGCVLNLLPWRSNIIGPSTDVIPIWSMSRNDPLSSEILMAMSNLSNHILANEAAKALMRFRRSHPSAFSSLVLYEQAHSLLSSYNYKLTVRRFILEPFPNDVLADHIIKLRGSAQWQVQQVRAT